MKCPGQQAHHIVPDFTLRWGNRTDGMQGVKRIPGLPSFWDGPAICMEGQAVHSDEEHGIAHGVDNEIKKLGGANGTAPVWQITKLSMEYAIKARPDCIKEIAKEIAKQPSLLTKTLARTEKYRRYTEWPPK